MFSILTASIILKNVRNKQNEPNVIKMETAYNLVTHLKAQSFSFKKKCLLQIHLNKQTEIQRLSVHYQDIKRIGSKAAVARLYICREEIA